LVLVLIIITAITKQIRFLAKHINKYQGIELVLKMIIF